MPRRPKRKIRVNQPSRKNRFIGSIHFEKPVKIGGREYMKYESGFHFGKFGARPQYGKKFNIRGRK